MNRMKYIFLSLFAGFLCTSCADMLDVKDLSSMSETFVWEDAALAKQFLNELYADRPGYEASNNPFLNNITDEGRNGHAKTGADDVLRGAWTSSTSLGNWMGFWVYTQVRKANEYIYGLETKATFNEDTRKVYLGEAKFLRALLYFDMVKRYGGVPLIDKPQGLEDNLFVPRATIDETFEFILKDLQTAITNLPRRNATEAGRATLGAAWALRSRVLLYWASPLFNSENKIQRWKDAADAAYEVIKLAKAGDYELSEDLNIWLTRDNRETIFEKQYLLGFKEHGWDGMHKPLSIAHNVGTKTNPTQEMVDAFPMTNGLLPHQEGSGYDDQNPYAGRDKRFYADIVYHLSDYCGRLQNCSVEGADLGFVDACGTSFCSHTGYYIRKGINEKNTLYDRQTGCDQSFIEIRYAEVLLNYAEALNEYEGPNDDVFEALDAVRHRAGITTDVKDILDDATDKEEVRKLIYNERRVELCFEQHRYFDIRRWKIAKEVMHGKRMHGMRITAKRDADGKPLTDEEGNYIWKYDPEMDIDKFLGGVNFSCVFEDYMYWMPIPYSELTKNPALIQNPEW